VTRGISCRLRPEVTEAELNALFDASWEDHRPRRFTPILERSLAYVCAYDGEELVGFVNLAWDGGLHAFLLDTTVHPEFRRCGIGTCLVERAVEAASTAGVEWVHVDYEPHLRGFYESCGFILTQAGLLKLDGARSV
jgi:GNAT superfamily N-acetyltransferase